MFMDKRLKTNSVADDTEILSFLEIDPTKLNINKKFLPDGLNNLVR